MSIQEEHFTRWKNREETAESMLPLIGKLYREKDIVISVYSQTLVNRSLIDILRLHRFVQQIEGEKLSVTETAPILQIVSEMDLGPSRIDIGKIAFAYKSQSEVTDLKAFVKQALAAHSEKAVAKPQDVVLYGFGRIGRIMARLLIEKAGSGNGLRLRAIVVRKGSGDDLQKRANLLMADSVHGPFSGTMEIDRDNNALIANGIYIPVIYSSSPSEVDYTQYDINDAIVIDNTGVWRDEDGLSQHLEAKGASRVILTAPGKGDLKNVVHGINNDILNSEDKIISAASCTTNAIVPVLKAVYDKFGLENGHVETVHAYTNDQNLIDNYHKGNRRGRAAALNMVITETGAAKAAAKALPVLQGKLTGNSIRVPTPNVSLAILNLTLDKETSLEELNDYLREIAHHSPLQRQIDYVNLPDAVSSDFVGSRKASVVDAAATIVNGSHCVLYVWYDNEMGYSCQVLRILQQLSGLEFPSYPEK